MSQGGMLYDRMGLLDKDRGAGGKEPDGGDTALPDQGYEPADLEETSGEFLALGVEVAFVDSVFFEEP